MPESVRVKTDHRRSPFMSNETERQRIQTRLGVLAMVQNRAEVMTQQSKASGCPHCIEQADDLQRWLDFIMAEEVDSLGRVVEMSYVNIPLGLSTEVLRSSRSTHREPETENMPETLA